ncbi:hypothetical protein AA0229_1966 [Gluconobacter cerinus NRIC 0229]|nr:hypothetical protein AA0229_1966 [Gluconobacter cerinus NRIC 0229]
MTNEAENRNKNEGDLPQNLCCDVDQIGRHTFRPVKIFAINVPSLMPCQGCTNAEDHSAKLGKGQAGTGCIADKSRAGQSCQTNLRYGCLPGEAETDIQNKLDQHQKEETSDANFSKSFHDWLDACLGGNECEKSHTQKGENNRESFFQRLRHIPFATRSNSQLCNIPALQMLSPESHRQYGGRKISTCC